MQADPRIAEAIAAFRAGDLDRARALASAQIAEANGPPDIHHLLGLIECRHGRIENGIEHLRTALDAQPDNPAFRVMLARALIDADRPEEALEVAMPPTEMNPAAIALWHVRGEAAQAIGNHSAAAEAWNILTVARPDDWRSWANSGEALANLGRWEEAASVLRRAWALKPRDISIRQNFASALTKAGFHEEAADQLRQMLEIGPDDTGTRLTLARMLADLGRDQEAMIELDRAARSVVDVDATGSLIRIAVPEGSKGEVSEREFHSLRELALLLERTNRLDSLKVLLDDAETYGLARDRLGYPAAAIALRDGNPAEAKRLLELEDADMDRVRWHRLMAKILDALGDSAGAFEAAVHMNRAMQDFGPWVQKGANYCRRTRALADTVTAEWVAQLQPLQPGSRRSPVFLVGFPRSGTTLLDTFLMGHPGTEVLEEFFMLGAAEKVLGNLARLPERTVEQLEDARRAYFAELDKHADAGFPGLIVDKLPLNMLGLPMIHSLFPEAKIVFAQRHPCDCVLSGFMQSFVLNDAMACFLTLGGSADLYDAAMRMFTISREALPMPVHTLVYEHLVSDPERALKPLIEFLGLDWRPELLDHRATARARGAIITPSYDQVVQPLSRAPTGRWKRYEEQMAPVLPVLLPWAKRLGYSD